MEDIKMTASKAPYAKLKQELDAAFRAVMESMSLKEGPQVERFAHSLENYLGVPCAIPCASGTDALRAALLLLQLPKGAEVVVPAFGDAAVVEVLMQMGLVPVFADVDADTFVMDAASVEKALSTNTAAIIATHLFGQPAPVQELMELALKRNVYLIEDATQALGATSTFANDEVHKAGSVGHIGFTSFFPTKPTSDSGEGGAVMVNDKLLVAQLQQLREGSLSLSADVLNQYRLDSLQAAMLEVKIKYVDAYIKERQEVALFYNKAFEGSQLVQVPHRMTSTPHVYHQYTIKVNPAIRDGLQAYLLENFIPSAVYYPQPLHLLDQYAHLNYKPGDFPESEKLSRSVLSLPMHTELKQDQLDYICHHVLTYVKRQT